MHITGLGSATSILRASRARFPASVSKTSLLNPPPFSPPYLTTNNQLRSLSFSSAVRSLRCSHPRWSHGVDWRYPATLRHQIRAVAPIVERFQRKIATMAPEHPFKGIFTSLPKPGGGEFGKFYSLPA
ncbi:hypothetical protein OIU76_008276, partial [Salix suchowensis]